MNRGVTQLRAVSKDVPLHESDLLEDPFKQVDTAKALTVPHHVFRGLHCPLVFCSMPTTFDLA